MRLKIVTLIMLATAGVFALIAIAPQGDQARADAPASVSLDAESITKADEEMLRSHRLATDPESLVMHLRKRLLPDTERAQIESLVQQLGSERFALREAASEQLVAKGRQAVSFLRAATLSSNREIASRAADCLLEIGESAELSVTSAVVRLLANRPNPNSLKTLLDFFPFADDEAVETEVLNGLGLLGMKRGKPDPLLAAAVKDPLPARRAAAAYVLARNGDWEQRTIVRQLLADPDLRVRYFIGKGLLGERHLKPETPLSVEDKRFLTAAHVSTDTASLIAFFKKRTLSDDDRKNVERFVQRLDSNQFAERQEASQALADIGAPALPFLREARDNGPSLEMSRRVEECIRKIELGPGPALPSAAARLLAQRAPAEAVQVLLDYAPFVDDATVEDEVVAALGVLSIQGPVVPAGLQAALKDAAAGRRAVAAVVLGQVGDKEHVETVRELLKDGKAQVRLRAAQGLLQAKDKSAVPVLVGLLTEDPLATQAEGLLQSLAGDKAPQEALGDPAEGARKKVHDAWAAWWRDHGEQLDIGSVDPSRAYLGLTAVADINANRVWEFGPDGKERWVIQDVVQPTDVRVLKGNRILVAEHGARKVTERDMTGKVLWEKPVNGLPIACQRLANGNTFIAHYNGAFEVRPDRTEVWAQNTINRGIIYDAVKLANGNFAFICGTGQLVEMDTGGKQIRQLQIGQNIGWSGLEVLSGGRYLVAMSNPGVVKEIDADNKILWQAAVPGAAYATRLPNGNTVIACHGNQPKVMEINRAGKTVWEKATPGRPFHVHRR